MPDAVVDEHLPEAELILGQIPLPTERLARAPRLRAVINVEGNWKPNLDYAECQRRGICVLSIAPAMGPAVAELCLALALDLARGVTAADRAFRRGEEAYGIFGNLDAFLLREQPIGMIGFGNLGRALRARRPSAAACASTTPALGGPAPRRLRAALDRCCATPR
jgi:phosphoglycerate dehydrogenase-like enzyme